MKNEYDYLNDISVDFSLYQEIPLTKKEYQKMTCQKRKSTKKYLLLAACVSTIAALGISAYASGFFGKIVKTVSTGHNEFSLIDMTGVSYPIPPELDGLLFDKNGVEITEFSPNTVYYDQDGNEITDLQAFARTHGITSLTTPEGTAKLSEEETDPLADAKKNGYPIIKNPEDISSHLSFGAKLPTYLPDGFTFLGAAAYGDQYLFVYYQNKDGNYIMLDERILNEETAFSVGTDGILEEALVNGHSAVLLDGTNLNWEADGVSIGISSRGLLSREELFQMAESIQ